MCPDLAPIRALVVDDNEVNQKVVTRMLNRLGCEVEVANDAREAVERASRGYTIIFMDCMQGSDGYEAARLIRAMDAPACQTPIVALTAHATPADRMACVAAGMDLWLPKPIAPEDLASAIGRFTSWKIGAAAVSQDSELDPGVVAEESELDPKVVERLRDLAGPDDPEFFSGLIEDFQSAADVLVDGARRAFALRDLGALRAGVERLRRTAATVGAVRLVELCERMETADDDTLLDRGPNWIRVRLAN